MKTTVLVFTIIIVFSSCDLFKDKDEDGFPVYQTKIAWDSGLYSNSYRAHMVDGDSVFFYERPPGYSTVNIYALTRLDAETGRFIWRSTVLFNWIIFCQPVVIGNYVYVFLQPNVILCFDRETGENTARVRVGIDNKKLEFRQFATAYQDYLYLGLWTNGNYFVRFDVNLIDQSGGTATQDITPEILWQPENGNFVHAQPIIYNNTVYTGSYDPLLSTPIEVAGFDTDTKEMVFHVSFGGPEEDIGLNARRIEGGTKNNPILIHDNVLYYLSTSISAWDIATGEKLYRHVFTEGLPYSQIYLAETLQAVFYKGNIYFTSGPSYEPGDYSFRNIHCINAATGELVWNAIAKNSESLDTNPVIAHDKLYVSLHNGLWVYNPKNGELIGVDKSFRGTGFGRNVLYKDYMICVREDKNGYEGKLVAVYVGE